MADSLRSKVVVAVAPTGREELVVVQRPGSLRIILGVKDHVHSVSKRGSKRPFRCVAARKPTASCKPRPESSPNASSWCPGRIGPVKARLKMLQEPKWQSLQFLRTGSSQSCSFQDSGTGNPPGWVGSTSSALRSIAGAVEAGVVEL